MPQLEGRPVPEPIVEQWRKVIEGAPVDDLLEFARANPDYARGARLTAGGLPLIRKRIQAALNAKGDLPAELVELLSRESLDGRFAIVLSEEALLAGFDEFAAVYGWYRWLSALLLDGRESIREMAVEQMAESTPPETESDDASLSLREAFKPFLVEIQAWSGRVPSNGSASPAVLPGGQSLEEDLHDRIGDLENQLAEMRERRSRVKQLERKVEKTTARIEARDRDVETLREELNAANERAKRLEGELEKERNELLAMKHSVEQRIRARVSEKLESASLRWMKKAAALGGAVGGLRENTGDDPLADARAVLARQAEVDLHFGNLGVLREQVASIEATLQEIRLAQTEALNPLPELARVARRLEQEQSRLRRLLPDDLGSPRDPLVTRLLGRINAAEDDGQLMAIRELIEQLAENELLDSSALRLLYHRYHDRTARLYNEFMPRVVQAASRRPIREPGWAVARGLDGEQDVTLILDGHNILHRFARTYSRPDLRFDPSDPSSRAALVDALQGMLPGRATCDVRLFFDGPQRSEQRHGPHLMEIFSGGGKVDQRADRAILDYLDFRTAAPPSTTMVLVSDDRELFRQAGDRGALHMPVDELAALVEERGVRFGEPK